MATRSLKPKRDDTMLTDWQSMPEIAPSATRTESTLAAQIFLFLGFFLGLVGVLAIVAPLAGWPYFLKPGMGYVSLTLGLGLMLYHCLVDPEPQFRRLYGMAATLLIFGMATIRVWPFQAGTGAYFLPIGLPLGFVALLFILGIVRDEKNPWWASFLRRVLLITGSLLLAFGLIQGHRDAAFLAGEGILVLLLSLAYLGGFLAMDDERAGDTGYHVALGLAAVGGLSLALAVIRSWTTEGFLVPSGLILGGVSLLALTIATFVACDWPLVVLTRRELSSFFYSPIAYLVLFGLLIIFGLHFGVFVYGLAAQRGGILEPIVQYYTVHFFPVVAIMVLVPIITMRLLSEEKRTGSLEQLLTAPINESTIILSKFLASLIFFLIAWVPYFLLMVSLRIFGGEEFDYRPLLSFFLALTATGGGMLAMGLFFSSLTANQIVAAVLTFAGMILQVVLWFLPGIFGGSGWAELLGSFSYLELWSECSRGFLPLRMFAFHLSSIVFFLFLTNLVMASRKWK